MACAAPPPETFGQTLELAVGLAEHGLRTDPYLLQNRLDNSFFVFEQRRQQVQRQQLRIAVFRSKVVAALHSFLRLYSGDSTWVTDAVIRAYTAGQTADIKGSIDAFQRMSKSKERPRWPTGCRTAWPRCGCWWGRSSIRARCLRISANC